MILCGIAGALIGAGIGATIGYLGKCSSGACLLTATPLRGMIFGALFGLFIALSYGCPWTSNTAYDKNANEGGLFITSTADFEKFVMESAHPVLVDFFSPTCPPCRKLSPTIVSLKEEYSGRAGVYKVDVTELPELASRYQITAVPTVSFFVGGNEVERLTGLNGKAVYSEIFDNFVESHPQ